MHQFEQICLAIYFQAMIFTVDIARLTLASFTYSKKSFGTKLSVTKRCDRAFVSRLRFLILAMQCFAHASSPFLPIFVSDLRSPKV